MMRQKTSLLKHIGDVPSTFGLKHIFDVFCLLCLKNFDLSDGIACTFDCYA